MTQKITKEYNLLTEEGFALPGLFIVDKDGIIQYYSVNNLLCGRSVNELIRILRSIQYIKTHPGWACPVDWTHTETSLSSDPVKSKQYFKNFYLTKPITPWQN